MRLMFPYGAVVVMSLAFMALVSTARAETPSGIFASSVVFSAAGQASAVFAGGSVDQLGAAAGAAQASGVWAQDRAGVFRLLVVGGPAFLNDGFRASFLDGFAAATAVTLVRLTSAPAPASTGASPSNDLRTYWSHGACTGSGPTTLTAPPLALEDTAAFVPMGLVTGGHVTPSDHVYFVPKDLAAGRTRYEVRAPADGHIVSIQRRGFTVEGGRATEEYRVVIEHSCTFWTYFDLMTQLAPRINEEIGEIAAGGPSRPIRVAVRAGEVIGRVGGQGLDFAVVNLDVTLPGFIVLAHYDREPWKIHTVDPIEYFAEPVRTQVLALNARTAVPRGGKIDHDIDGRLVGNWFGEGTNGYAGARGNEPTYWTGHLSFTYHHIDPSVVLVSIGNFNGAARSFAVRGNGPDPRSIGPEATPTKYELVLNAIGQSGQRYPVDTGTQGTVLVQLLDDRRLRFEAFPGRTVTEVRGFTAGAVVYER